MITPEKFYDELQKRGIQFYTGVPDSLMKSFLLYVEQNAETSNHIIAANEGLAIALAVGYHLRTGQLPLVYMQNSGLGNAVNPLMSIADKEVYAIPMLLLIGWRGMPGTEDEPQHIKMGRITKELLETMEIPVFQITENENLLEEKLNSAIEKALSLQQPVALLAHPGCFSDYKSTVPQPDYELSREQVLEKFILNCMGDEMVVCTTGKTGREFFELNSQYGEKIKSSFLSVGGMGLANHIALGLANDKKKIIMFDGDGAVLMHMGSLAQIGIQQTGSPFLHIVLNNGSHESVGAQPTLAFVVNLCKIASACGYKKTKTITTENELNDWLMQEFNAEENQFIEIRINNNSRANLSRPAGKPQDWKKELMETLQKK